MVLGGGVVGGCVGGVGGWGVGGVGAPCCAVLDATLAIAPGLRQEIQLDGKVRETSRENFTSIKDLASLKEIQYPGTLKKRFPETLRGHNKEQIIPGKDIGNISRNRSVILWFVDVTKNIAHKVCHFCHDVPS